MDRTIEEAEELTRKILSRSIRRSLGWFYILWSLYIIPAAIIYSVPLIKSYVNYISIIFWLIYFAYTYVIFHKAYKRNSFLRIPKKKFYNLIYTFIIIILAFTVIWAYFIIIFYGFSYNIIYNAIYVIVVSILLWNIINDTGKIRYYDFIAIITFIISMLSGPINNIYYYVYIPFWVFSGIMSLIESNARAEDDK